MKIQIVSVVAIAALLSACSSTKYYVDKDSSVDFTKYKTFQYYGWAEESNKILNDLDQRRIEKAFGDELEKRNLQYVEQDGDLIVTLYIVTEERTQTTANTTHMGGGYGYGGYYGWGPAYGWGPSSSHTTFNEYQYTVGTLIIDIYDAGDKKLIWESIAQGTIDEKTKGRDERIRKVVANMMKDYPVPAPEAK